MNAISVLKNVECFEVAVVLGMEETTLLPCCFSPQPLTLCEKNGLKWAIGQRNRNINEELLMTFQFLRILWKEWKIHWAASYYGIHHPGSLCAACHDLEGLGCFGPGLLGWTDRFLLYVLRNNSWKGWCNINREGTRTVKAQPRKLIIKSG